MNDRKDKHLNTKKKVLSIVVFDVYSFSKRQIAQIKHTAKHI